MSDNKVQITLKDMIVLRENAERIGTLDKWSTLAVEFMETQADEITRLNGKITELGG